MKLLAKILAFGSILALGLVEACALPEYTVAESSGSGAGGGGGGSPGGFEGVRCGPKTCTESEVCCFAALASGTTGQLTCIMGIPCAGVPVPCDGPEDCNGGQCCAKRDSSTGKVTEVGCGSCDGGDNTDPLCHIENGNADCDNGRNCVAGPLGYAACKG
jgi:hypothetical protein